MTRLYLSGQRDQYFAGPSSGTQKTKGSSSLWQTLVLALFGILVLVVLSTVSFTEKQTLRPQFPSPREPSERILQRGRGRHWLTCWSKARLPEHRPNHDWSATPPVNGGADRWMKGGRVGARSFVEALLGPAGRWEPRSGFALPLSLTWAGSGALRRLPLAGGQQAGKPPLSRPSSDRPALATPGYPQRMTDPQSPLKLGDGRREGRAPTFPGIGLSPGVVHPSGWGVGSSGSAGARGRAHCSDGHFVRGGHGRGKEGLGSLPSEAKVPVVWVRTWEDHRILWAIHQVNQKCNSPRNSFCGNGNFFRVHPLYSMFWGKEWLPQPFSWCPGGFGESGWHGG